MANQSSLQIIVNLSPPGGGSMSLRDRVRRLMAMHGLTQQEVFAWLGYWRGLEVRIRDAREIRRISAGSGRRLQFVRDLPIVDGAAAVRPGAGDLPRWSA